MSLKTIMQEFADSGFKIQFNGESFTLFMGCGRCEMIETGWTLTACSGMPCSYATRSKEAVRKALGFGYEITEAARQKLNDPLTEDDPTWAAQKEIERIKKCRAQGEERFKWIAAQTILVKSARAKLTEEEFEAVVNEGRE